MPTFNALKENKKIHRGEVLEKAVQQSDLSKTIIAKRAGYTRSSLYIHCSKADLPFDILERYGKALGFDFTTIFPEMITYISFEEPEAQYKQALTFEQMVKQRDQWRNKYYDLLEKYNRLIEDKYNLNDE